MFSSNFGAEKPMFDTESFDHNKPDYLEITKIQAQRLIVRLGDVSESNITSKFDDDLSMQFTIGQSDQVCTGKFSSKYS